MADKRTVAEGRGSVYVGGKVYVEGDEVPEGVKVGEHVFTSPADKSTPTAATVLTQPLVSSIDGEQAEPVPDDFDGAVVDAPGPQASDDEESDEQAKPRSRRGRAADGG